MSDAPEMLPCPFCGGEAELRNWDWPYVRYQVRCGSCKAGPVSRLSNREAAIAAWNRRDTLTDHPAVKALVAVAEARGMERAVTTDPASAFNRADWFWRAMDPDDCGDSPEEAINRAMVGRFRVCEIASSYAGPTRYGFIAPVLDPESDDEEFVHFATQQEAIDEAKRRAEAATLREGETT